jgi:hypothetical protein
MRSQTDLEKAKLAARRAAKIVDDFNKVREYYKVNKNFSAEYGQKKVAEARQQAVAALNALNEETDEAFSKAIRDTKKSLATARPAPADSTEALRREMEVHNVWMTLMPLIRARASKESPDAVIAREAPRFGIAGVEACRRYLPTFLQEIDMAAFEVPVQKALEKIERMSYTGEQHAVANKELPAIEKAYANSQTALRSARHALDKGEDVTVPDHDGSVFVIGEPQTIEIERRDGEVHYPAEPKVAESY